MKNKFLGVLTAMTLCACGGGGGGDSSSTPTASVYKPSAAVLAARQANYPTRFWAVLDPATLPPGTTYGAYGTCSGIDMNTTVYVLPNTITYAAKGVSELSQQQVAEYSEKAVAEIKNALGIASGVGYKGQPIQICTETGLIYGSAQGAGDKNGFLVMSSDSTNLDKGFLANDFDMYKRLVKHELVHTYHNATLDTDNAILDTWFAEGLAEYIASGKSSKSKTDIMNLVNAQNPTDITTAGIIATGNLFANYPAFQSSVAYLFDQSGAKNNLTSIPTFLTLAKTNFDNLSTNCGITNTCSTARSLAFQQTFDASFKEPDGTAMKLRTGANNFRDTIVTRLTNFLQ
jgi:hypothetical protein